MRAAVPRVGAAPDSAHLCEWTRPPWDRSLLRRCLRGPPARRQHSRPQPGTMRMGTQVCHRACLPRRRPMSPQWRHCGQCPRPHCRRAPRRRLLSWTTIPPRSLPRRGGGWMIRARVPRRGSLRPCAACATKRCVDDDLRDRPDRRVARYDLG